MINNFKANGFTVVRNILNNSEIKILLSEIENIKKKFKRVENKRYFHLTNDNKFNTIHNIQKFYKSKKLKSIIEKKKLIKILKEILSKNLELRNLEFFLKPKKTGMASPMHQDNFYWNLKNAKGVNVWIALSNANRFNGGLKYLKGSHRFGTYNHTISGAKGTSQKIPNNLLSKLKFKSITPSLKKGDCIIHHCEVVHGSNSNNSMKDRVGVAISFKDKFEKVNSAKMSYYQKKLKLNLKTINN